MANKRTRTLTLFLLLQLGGFGLASIDSDTQALLDLYETTGGGSCWTAWANATGSVCSWTGIGCDTALTMVVSVQLSNMSLCGYLSPSICQLTNVQLLYLSNNRIAGSIPSCIGALTSLQDFRMTQNLLSGPIPASFCALTQLEIFYFNHNQLNGSIPLCVPGSLPNLNDLQLFNNSISGTLDPICQFSAGLSVLYLSNNVLHGSIPACFQQFSNMTNFGVHNNSMTGAIPNFICTWSLFEEMRFSNNSFDGELPDCLGSLVYLEFLDVSNNSLSGGVNFLCGMFSIYYLDLSNNAFEGEIPQCLCTSDASSAFLAIRMSNNFLSGTLPESFALCSNLTYLDVSQNSLSGSFPWPILASCLQMKYFAIANNGFSGGLPSSVRQWSPQLQLFLISVNEFAGPIPEDIGSLSELRVLGAAANLLSGPIPSSISSLAHLQQLDLSFNELSGLLPPLSGLENLQRLNVRRNQLSGTFPMELVNQLGTLIELKLDLNLLSCELPTNVSEESFAGFGLDGLSVLDGNIFACPIPEVFLETDAVGEEYSCGSAPVSFVNTLGAKAGAILLGIVLIHLFIRRFVCKSPHAMQQTSHSSTGIKERVWQRAVNSVFHSAMAARLGHTSIAESESFASHGAELYSRFWEIVVIACALLGGLLIIGVLLPIYSFSSSSYLCRYLYQYSIAYLDINVSAAWSWIAAIVGGLLVPSVCLIPLTMGGILLGFISTPHRFSGAHITKDYSPVSVLIRRGPKRPNAAKLLAAYFRLLYGPTAVNNVQGVPPRVAKLEYLMLANEHNIDALLPNLRAWEARNEGRLEECFFVTFASMSIAKRCLNDASWLQLPEWCSFGRAKAFDNDLTASLLANIHGNQSIHDIDELDDEDAEVLEDLADPSVRQYLKNMRLDAAPWPQDVMWQNIATDSFSKLGRRMTALAICGAVIFLQVLLNIAFVLLERSTSVSSENEWLVLLSFALLHEILHHLIHPISVKAALAVLGEASRRHHVELGYRLSVFMGTCNAVFVPLVAILLFNPSCFLLAFIPETSETSTLSYTYCASFLEDTCTAYATGYITSLIEYPFRFDPSCFSSATLQYTPAFIGVLLVRAVFVPIWWLVTDLIPFHIVTDKFAELIQRIPWGKRGFAAHTAHEARYRAAGLHHAIHVAHVVDTLALTICMGLFSPFVYIAGLLALVSQHFFRWFMKIDEEGILNPESAAHTSQTTSDDHKGVDAATTHMLHPVPVPMPWSCSLMLFGAYNSYLLVYFFYGSYPGRYLLVGMIVVQVVLLILGVRKAGRHFHQTDFMSFEQAETATQIHASTFSYECPFYISAERILLDNQNDETLC